MTVRKSILGASLFVIPLLAGCAQAVQPAAVASAPPSATTREGAYTASIYKSAVKLPSFQVPLIPIDTTQPSVTVISLATSTPVAPSGKLSDDTWISLPADLLAHCKGKADPVLALEQILGMPPASGNWQLFQFSVSPKRIFRPCASGPSVATAECSFSLPASFPSAAARETYEATQRFVFNQMWTSYVAGMSSPGYPFTGMGWTYDWSPDSPSHVGISEYVVRKQSPVSNVSTITPAQFCGGSATSS